MSTFYKQRLQSIVQKYSRNFTTSDIIRTGDLSVVVPGDLMSSIYPKIDTPDPDSEDSSNSDSSRAAERVDRYLDRVLPGLIYSALSKTPADVLERLFPGLDSPSESSLSNGGNKRPLRKADKSPTLSTGSASNEGSFRLQSALHDFEKSVNAWKQRTAASKSRSPLQKSCRPSQKCREIMTYSATRTPFQQTQSCYVYSNTTVPPLSSRVRKEQRSIGDALLNLDRSVERWERRTNRLSGASHSPYSVHLRSDANRKHHETRRESRTIFKSHLDYRSKTRGKDLLDLSINVSQHSSQATSHSSNLRLQKSRRCFVTTPSKSEQASSDDGYFNADEASDQSEPCSTERVIRWLNYQKAFGP